ncbi:MAG: tRNA guanosine(34) transglycosylase Tgt [Candidatus Paceibacterota bacterium]
MEFEIIKRSKKSKARLGLLKTANGVVETPAFVGVATKATIKTLSTEDVERTGTQILISNTFHLHLRPGEDLVKANGGVHQFMGWKHPMMTDSGGFQVFSLGFGTDHGVGKILKKGEERTIEEGMQPQKIKITEKGVEFRSPVDGAKLFLGPKESIAIQEKIGADIILAFDECPSPLADYEYMKTSMARTHRWAEICLKVKKNKKQAMYGIVQGGKWEDLRKESACAIGAMGFDGFAIGGEFGYDKEGMAKMIETTLAELPNEKPVHLLGVGHPEDFEYIIKSGVDTFDCIAPTHYARHGTAFTSGGRLYMKKTVLLKDKKPLDPKCGCYVCKNYTRSYLAHLFRAGEYTGMHLVTFHNLYYLNNLAKEFREKIRKGLI